MSIKVSLGGDRLGSGNRMKQALHNFNRSNHNLSCRRNTSASPGVLYPIYCNPVVNGDTFDIDASAFVRTYPTKGPLFGKFKLQVDFFSYPVRLAQAILHNNTTKIGLKMNQVLLPKMELETFVPRWQNKLAEQFDTNTLVKYLGISGIGLPYDESEDASVSRKFNAVPMLAYYEIFKEYYANKQEENAYVITSGETTKEAELTSTISSIQYCKEGNCEEINYNNNYSFTINDIVKIIGTNLVVDGKLNFNIQLNGQEVSAEDIKSNLEELFAFIRLDSNLIELEFIRQNGSWSSEDLARLTPSTMTGTIYENGGIRLNSFPLDNIDKMRKRLLGEWDLGEEVVIDKNETLLPYQVVTAVDDNGYSYNKNPLNGLLVKTYQSDMFNNWLDTDWINEINELSKVDTSNGGFTIDALNFANKIYDLYNRIAVHGATYLDWQEAVYGEKVYGSCEVPMYHGGLSSEIVFDEVVSSAGTVDQPLGSLGGRGNLNERDTKGGKIVIKVKEPSFIIAIASITPRLSYTQGNSWYMTELDSIDDFHKPNLDRIGFQDLMIEQMAWWDTKIDSFGTLHRKSAGKQPAWIHYTTDVDKSYGDFALGKGLGYMVLQRLYDYDENREVSDVTTYIDPTKYNYAFVNANLDAQNFWLFCHFDIKARRKMSATQIPNL